MDVNVDLTTIWAFIIAFAVFAYVVMDGFDLGIGILFPTFEVGPERDRAMNSIAPVWDGNETWLVLGGGGFDPGRDIVAIAVNRWPHGYAYTYNSLYDPMEWVFTSTNERPCVIGRQPFGQITIANSDAAASPHTDAAILEAHRAVQEVLQRRAMPVLGG